MPAAIETSALTKYYGETPGLLGIDLSVEQGEVFGYLGPNGAGKTTTIRLLLDLIRPSSGSATVLGLDVASRSLEIRERVGYLPGELSLYEKMTVRELIAYLSALRSMPETSYAEEVARQLDLDMERTIGELSKGNKQKVGLLQAMMHRPELLILDEPTSGLDPFVQRNVHRLLAEARDEGKTVFLSSHVLHEVEEIADRIGIVSAGRMIAVERIQDLKDKAVREVEIHFGEPVSVEVLQAVAHVESATVDGSLARVRVKGSLDPLIKAIAQHEVLNLVAHEADLEEIFFAYYEGAAR